MTEKLEGTTVLITRSEQGNAELRRLLEERGAKVLALPTVEFVDPDSWEQCDGAIINLRKYDGFLFSSRNAVERFLRRIDEVNRQAKEILKQRAVYAVGEKTEAALQEAGIPVAMTPEFSSSEELAASFGSQAMAGKRLLFPKSDIARDILPNALRELDAIVDEIVVYKNIAPRQNDLDSFRNALLNREIDVVTFFSPSAVRNFVQLMGQKCLHVVIVAVIGKTTESAASGFGITSAITAPSATTESLVGAISEYIHSGKNL